MISAELRPELCRYQCGAEQDEFDIIESPEGLRFICEDCND